MLYSIMKEARDCDRIDEVSIQTLIHGGVAVRQTTMPVHVLRSRLRQATRREPIRNHKSKKENCLA